MVNFDIEGFHIHPCFAYFQSVSENGARMNEPAQGCNGVTPPPYTFKNINTVLINCDSKQTTLSHYKVINYEREPAKNQPKIINIS